MKNILVVGCLGGIGKATSIELINNGYNVIGLDINDICDVSNIDYYKIDIRNENSIIQAYNKISEKYNDLYCICILSGIYMMDSLLEISEEELKKILDINFIGITRINRIFFPLLKKGSRILITSSEVAPLDPLPFNGIYGIIKTLVDKYAYSLRMEVNIFGIDVITLRPGAIKTTLLNDSMNELDKFCNKTKIHKTSSVKFKKVVNSVESKSIEPKKIGKFILKILNKKHPKYIYSINSNFLLKLLNVLPSKLQIKIISKIIK